ncbi:MAG: cyclic nucleotide-binding domain-containing protein [Chloroflexaceae bacterium]|nr:cyclic nucleotide-binding domain-containing protein [Chloroflexaceae bacterium]
MNEQAMQQLRRLEIFQGLHDEELLKVVNLCRIWRIEPDQIIFKEGDIGDEMFFIHEGSVTVSITTRSPEGGSITGTINTLFAGQSFGEMVLMDGANRSATVTSIEPCVLLVLRERDFANLCGSYPRIGYRVMYNLACDLAYKLRSSNLLLRGNIRWRRNELSRRA